jgi:hypothetical protein
MLPPGTAARSPTAVVSPTPGRRVTRPRSSLAPAAVLLFPPADDAGCSPYPGSRGCRGRFGGVACGQQDDKPADQPVHPPGEAGELRARGSETPAWAAWGPRSSPPGTGSPRPGPHNRHAVPTPGEALVFGSLRAHYKMRTLAVVSPSGVFVTSATAGLSSKVASPQE